MNSEIQLVAIDIDGTLLDSRGRVPDAHRDAVVEAAARGLEIALVTGRSFHFSRPIADALPVPVTLIVNNGAMVKDGAGVTQLRHLLARDAAHAVLSGTRPTAMIPRYSRNAVAPAGNDVPFLRRCWPALNRPPVSFEIPTQSVRETETLAASVDGA